MMFFGASFFGRTDEVPRLFYVTTRFLHVWFVPFVPTGSWLVFQPDWLDRGIQIRLSFKSVLLAWVRTACVITTLFGALMGGIIDTKDTASWFMVSGCSLAGFWFLRSFGPFRWAGYERALVLARKAGLRKEGETALAHMYGKISEADARYSVNEDAILDESASSP